MVKNLPAMLKTHVQPLVWEDLLEWLPTAVFLPGKFHRQTSLKGYSPCGHKESDMTEQLRSSMSKIIQYVTLGGWLYPLSIML